MKNLLIGLLVLCGVVFGGSALVKAFDRLHAYPKDYNSTCYVGWMEGYFYHHEYHYDMSGMPEVIPPEGWEPPLLWEAFCLNPNGAWVAVKVPGNRAGGYRLTYIPSDEFTF